MRSAYRAGRSSSEAPPGVLRDLAACRASSGSRSLEPASTARDVELLAGAHAPADRARSGCAVRRRGARRRLRSAVAPRLRELEPRDQRRGAPRRGRRRCAARAPCAKKRGERQCRCDTPAPPWIWIASSTTRCSTFGATTLIAEISVIAPSAPTLVELPRRVEREQARLVDGDARVGDALAVAAEVEQRLAERGARACRARSSARARARPRRCSACSGGCGPGPRRPCAISKPMPGPGDDVGARHAHVLEVHLAVAVRRVVLAEHRQHALDRSRPARRAAPAPSSAGGGGPRSRRACAP